MARIHEGMLRAGLAKSFATPTRWKRTKSETSSAAGELLSRWHKIGSVMPAETLRSIYRKCDGAKFEIRKVCRAQPI